jgi:hypothetical protein
VDARELRRLRNCRIRMLVDLGEYLLQLAFCDLEGLMSRPNSFRPMRGEHHRNASLEPLYALKNSPLIFVVEGARRFVEDQQSWLVEKSTRQRKSLPLAARKTRAAAADDRVHT